MPLRQRRGLTLSWYNRRWLFSNGVRWFRVGRDGFGWWEQRIDKAKPSRYVGAPEYPDGPPDPDEWYEGDRFPWEWPWRPYIRLWWSRKRRVAVLLPAWGRKP